MGLNFLWIEGSAMPVTREASANQKVTNNILHKSMFGPQTWEQRSGKWCRGPATELLPLDQHFRWWWRLTVMPSLTGLAACNTDVISGWNGLIYLICGVYLVKETHSLFGKSFSLPQWLMAVIHFLHQLLAVRNTCYQNCHSCVCLFIFYYFSLYFSSSLHI